MRREPPITFRGALQLLGHYDRPLVDRLDRLLGGVILTAGALATVPALAALAPIFGWVDQKNEATGLLRTCLDRVQSRLSGVHGYDRIELLAAAHTMIVISAFFDEANHRIPQSDITSPEKERLVAGRWRAAGESLVSMLWTVEVPMPGGAVGFAEVAERVDECFRTLSDSVYTFLDGLDVPRPREPLKAGRRYREYYLRLANTVPDFWIWAQLGEHTATRAALAEARADVLAALDGPGAALSRIEALLSTLSVGTAAPGRLREALARANRDVLDRPVVGWPDTDDSPGAITFPTIAESYINPRYRLTVAGGVNRPADESWWADQPVRTDVDLMITTLLTAFGATRRLLLLLGHPGGGKSMFSKVLAARLPAESYTVVRVPLRQVVANAPLHDQIRHALDLSTHGRVTDWFALADDGAPTVRIVLLDGLDELLQASTHDRSGFLREVMEFQRGEAAQNRPVIVVVTSRTVVAERVDIPAGTPIAKLEEFDDDQVGDWLDIWRRTNAAGRLRLLTRTAALAHPELARQPLLLLMLAIYWADPDQSIDAGELSLTDLYHRLLTSFAVREVRKKADAPLRGRALDEAVAEQLHRLSIAAIGMFNRGRQDITEPELGADLDGVSPDSGFDAETLGQRVLGEFFFVHAAEARVRGEKRDVRRCYEFLHSTFGEFLVASLVVDVLADVAEAAHGGTRGPRAPSDDLLHALLSHQTMASRKPILEFAGELLRRQSEQSRDQIARTLETLARGCDRRADGRRYPRYRPVPESNLRPLAAYSANLVLLRGLLDERVPLDALCPEHEAPLTRWRSTVTLWRAGLDADGWQAMLDSLALHDDAVRLRLDVAYPPGYSDIQYARLIGDRDAELQLRLGSAFHRKLLYYVDDDRWSETMTSWLLPAVIMPAGELPGYILVDPPPGTSDDDLTSVLGLVSDAMVRQAGSWTDEFTRQIFAWILRNGLMRYTNYVSVAVAIAHHPTLLSEYPMLATQEWHPNEAAKFLLWTLADPQDGRLTSLVEALRPADDYPASIKDTMRTMVAHTTEPGRLTSLPSSDGYSIFTMREDGPVPMGSITGTESEQP